MRYNGLIFSFLLTVLGATYATGQTGTEPAALAVPGTTSAINDLKTTPKLEVRYGWSMLSDDGSYARNLLVFRNWENITLGSLPATFSVHYTYKERPNGFKSQVGLVGFYTASQAKNIFGVVNTGTATYFSSSIDFRTVSPTVRYLGNEANFHLGYGAGYTYRSVGLANHEPMGHLSIGTTAWLSEDLGITLIGTAQIGTLNVRKGANYIQASALLAYRF